MKSTTNFVFATVILLAGTVFGKIGDGSIGDWLDILANGKNAHPDSNFCGVPIGRTNKTEVESVQNTVAKGDLGIGTKTGDTKTLTLPGGVTMEMIYVAPGSFMMGSPSSEDGRGDDETLHRVTLTRGFWLGKYEVTQRQWQSVMGNNPSRFKSPDRPVENVSWYDCLEFLRKINAHMPCGARFPTEAEWEYACRAGTDTSLPSGENLVVLGVCNGRGLDPIAWYGGNSCVAFELSNGDDCSGWKEKEFGGALAGTHHVGKKGANKWGFYDMIGNVLEWCEDPYDKDYYSTCPVIDPCNRMHSGSRILRGGSWRSSACGCRSASRYSSWPYSVDWSRSGDRGGGNYGFRLCCSAQSCGETIENKIPVATKKPGEQKAENSRNEPNEPRGNFGVGTKTGETKTLTLPGGATMEMIYVAPGSFMMGSPSSEEGRNDDEKQHRVTLTKGFWLGKYEVTQAQWRSVMGNNPSDFKGDNLPVDTVSWDDCQMFIARVNNQLNCGARLPTEAEWEYACRAGTTTAYFWGNSLSGDKANCDGNYPCGTTVKGPYRGTTVQVGSYPANARGFCDMHGNVCEWCNDWYGQYPTGSVTDPLGSASGDIRVLRGGSWNYNARSCRSANRRRVLPGGRNWYFGFRLCCSALP